MNCPICGTELDENEDLCPNCGTRRIEMGIFYSNISEKLMEGNGKIEDPAAYEGMTQSVLAFAYKMRKIMYIVSALVMVGMIIFCVFMYRRYAMPCEQEIGNITITFPQRLESAPDDVFNATSWEHGECFRNEHMGFVYIQCDLDDYGLDESDVSGQEKLFISDMDKDFENKIINYKKREQSDDRLLFEFDNHGQRYYADMRIVVKDKYLYMFVAYCKSDEESSYAKRIEKMYDSIKYRS